MFIYFCESCRNRTYYIAVRSFDLLGYVRLGGECAKTVISYIETSEFQSQCRVVGHPVSYLRLTRSHFSAFNDRYRYGRNRLHSGFVFNPHADLCYYYRPTYAYVYRVITLCLQVSQPKYGAKYYMRATCTVIFLDFLSLITLRHSSGYKTLYYIFHLLVHLRFLGSNISLSTFIHNV